MESNITLNRSDDDATPQGFFNPKRASFRFLALVFVCLLSFGTNLCYDNPAALQDNFKSDLDMPTSEFVLLYSVYSWSSVILCFIGGFLLDRVFGLTWGRIIYAMSTLIGQLMFATGAYINALWLMILGRFVFGMGAESLIIAQNSYTVLLFKDKEVNMVFGLKLSFSSIGSTVNFLIMENIYSYVSNTLRFTGPQRIGIILFITALSCVVALICAIVLGFMDKRAEKVMRQSEGRKTKIIKFTDVKSFKIIFWLITWICVAYYAAIIPFIALGKVFFIEKYGLDPDTANTVNSLVYSMAIIGCPLFGMIVDRTGRNVIWIGISIITALIAHGLLVFTYVTPYVGMVLLGLSYSLLTSSLYPLVALVVPEHQLGTAYGTVQSLHNLGLALTAIVSGIIVEKHDYFMLEIFFIVWLVTSLITAVCIWMSDRSVTGGYLNMSPRQRKQCSNVCSYTQ